MGVMSCARESCDNIMCDTYVNDVGYVCNDCQKEFKEYLNKECISVITEIDIYNSLKHFMETPKDYYIEEVKIKVDEFFKSKQ